MADNKKIKNVRAWKYGTLSVVLTALVLAAVILCNALVTMVASRYPLAFTMDLTEEGLYTISDECREFIDEYLNNDTADIKIYFCKERDQLDQDGEYVLMVRNLIERFEATYDSITVEYVDIFRDPAFARKYTTESGVSLYTSSIIVENEVTGQFRQLAPAAFFSTAQSTGELYGFRGEVTLTNAIIRVSGEAAPAVTFTSNHGEAVDASLASMLYDAGFEIKEVDLSTQEIPENTKMLVVCDPQKDFAGYFEEDGITPSEQTNEIQKVADYLLKKNHLVVMVDPDTPDLPNLRELLGEWGLDYQVGTRLYDFTNSIGTDGLSLVSQYYSDNNDESDEYESSAAYAIHKPLSTMSNPPKTIVRDCVPLKLDYSVASDVDITLCTSDTALAFNSTDGEVSDEDADQALGHGVYPLMAVSSQSEYIGEAGAQALQHTAVVLIGSTQIASDSFVGTGSYGNKEIFYQLARLMGSQNVPNGLEFKKFATQALDITAGEARAWTIVVSVIVPLAVGAVGFYVWRKRRHA